MKKFSMLALLLLWTATSLAAPDAAQVVGDLKVDGIHFSKDGSTMNSANGIFITQGAWSPSISYSVGAVVQVQSVLYVCINANTNIVPPNATYWAAMSAQQGPQTVHGIVGSNGEYYPDRGFTVTNESVGIYIITFNPMFSNAPDCVVTSLGHTSTSDGYKACELAVVMPTVSSMRVSCIQFRPEYNPNTHLYYYTAEVIATPFSFICMN